MRCVKCNMELSEDSRFCEYCGAPQPERPKPAPPVQPQQARCCKCGRELPGGSRFCTFCGAPQPEGAQPGYGAGTSGRGGQEPQKKADKNKKILIGCIIGLAVLLIAAVILTVVFITKRKNDGWGEEEKEERTRKEREIDEEEEDEEELPEEEEIEEEEIEEPAAEPEPEEEAEEEPEEETIDAEKVDFSIKIYEPEAQPYDLLSIEEVMELNNSMSNTRVDDNYCKQGELYSVSDEKYLSTYVYYVPETSDILNITTMQGEKDDFRMYMYTFDGTGKLKQANEADSPNVYNCTEVYTTLYAEDCMAAMTVIQDGKRSEAESYIRDNFESMSQDEQSLFLEKESEYLNRAYILYDIVSQW